MKLHLIIEISSEARAKEMMAAVRSAMNAKARALQTMFPATKDELETINRLNSEMMALFDLLNGMTYGTFAESGTIEELVTEEIKRGGFRP